MKCHWLTNTLKSSVEAPYNRDKFIGNPEPSKAFTVDQLILMGMVGIYAKDEEKGTEVKVMDYETFLKHMELPK